MKKVLVVIFSICCLISCNSGVGGSGGGNNPNPPSPQTLTSLNVNVRPEQDKFFYQNSTTSIESLPPYGLPGQVVKASVDAREFMVDPVVNITYTNTESFPIILSVGGNGIIPDCGIPNNNNICPFISNIPNYSKYSNQCNSYPGQTNRLTPGQSCIQSLRIYNGWNFTNSEVLHFTDVMGYGYNNEMNPEQRGGGVINIDVLVGITQNLGKVDNTGGISLYSKMLPTPDANYFYRLIPNANGSIGKYQITYNDTNRTATLNTTPVAIISKPYAGSNTMLVGIANNGDPIGNSQDTTPYLQNYINKIEYGWGTPEVAPGYDNMFVGLDGNNYAVNGDNAGGNFYTGDTLATFEPNATTITKVSIPQISGNYLVTEEGTVIYTGAQQYCYIKSSDYIQQSINFGNAPEWVDLTKATHDIYEIGNKVYMLFATTDGFGDWFAINGTDCSINWDDARRLLLQSYYGAGNYGIYTNNNRVLYGIWDNGRVLYYSYPPIN